MAGVEHRGEQPQPEEGNFGRRQFLKDMALGWTAVRGGLVAYAYEMRRENPSYLRAGGGLFLAGAGIVYNFRAGLKAVAPHQTVVR
jgi:hypothetical protein